MSESALAGNHRHTTQRDIMGFSEFELKRIDKVVGGLCRQKSPQALHDKLRYDYQVTGNDVVIVEIRPHWKDPNIFTETALARFRYHSDVRVWSLYWQRANLQWVPYETHHRDRVLDALVKEVQDDAFSVFFG
jgi:hypothetical protein